MKSFPKIWHLGHVNIKDLFSYTVDITEKIDGSQFAFGWDKDGNYHCRSKGTMIDLDNVPNLFFPVVEWSRNLEPEPDRVLYGETLCKPKHNSLKYDRVPTNHFTIFGLSNFAGDKHTLDHAVLKEWARVLECDVVPLLHRGRADFELVESLLDKPSYLGGVNAEGVVVKANVPYELYGQYVPIMCGKYVTESFKEVHAKNPEFRSGKSKVQGIFDRYRTEARWEKAVSYLKEMDECEGDPRDIGKLMKRVQQDVEEECMEEIKEALWTIYRKDFIRNAAVGLPEWYKRKLASGE